MGLPLMPFNGGNRGKWPALQGAYQTTYSTASSGVTATLPAGIVAGETLLMIACCAITATAPSTPSGWTLVAAPPSAAGASTVAIYTKTATGSDTNPSLSSGVQRGWAVWIGRYTGCFGVEAVSGPMLASGGPTVNPPNVSPSWGTTKKTRFIAVASLQSNANSLSSGPAGYSEVSSLTAGVGSDDLAAAIAHKNAKLASEDPGVFTFSGAGTGNGNCGATIALRGT